MNRRRLARLLIHAPWLTYLALILWRRLQPWVTVGAVGVIFNEQNELLMVEHVFHPKAPWGLPGGWSGRNENPAETVRREVREETGLAVELLKPLLVEHTPFLRNHLDVAYLCYVASAQVTITLSSELLDYRWVNPLLVKPTTHFHDRAIQAGIKEWQQMGHQFAEPTPE